MTTLLGLGRCCDGYGPDVEFPVLGETYSCGPRHGANSAVSMHFKLESLNTLGFFLWMSVWAFNTKQQRMRAEVRKIITTGSSPVNLPQLFLPHCTATLSKTIHSKQPPHGANFQQAKNKSTKALLNQNFTFLTMILFITHARLLQKGRFVKTILAIIANFQVLPAKIRTQRAAWLFFGEISPFMLLWDFFCVCECLTLFLSPHSS